MAEESGGDAVGEDREGGREARLGTRMSPREAEITGLMLAGLTTRQVAERIGLAETSVKGALARLMRRYGCHNRVQLLAFLLQRRLGEADELGGGLS